MRGKAKTAGRRPSRKPSAAPAPTAPSIPPRAASSAPGDLEAQRALLADPATIASGAKPPAPVSRPAKPSAAQPSAKPATRPAERPAAETRPSVPKRPALARRPAAAKPIDETKRADTPSAARPPSSPSPSSSPIARTALLDATRAQRLAREARLRERDSREALARAREALEGPPSAEKRRSSAPRTSSSAQWQRHPLSPAPTTTPAPAPTAAPEPFAPALGRSLPPAAERALAAELREARATLAIARETTQIQRDELARLRSVLAQASSAPTPAAAEPTELLEQLARLSARVQELEIDLDHRERERAQLIEALAASEREQAERARQLAALQDRYDVQEQALDQARRQSELERRRHTEAQATLDRLRAALRGIEGEVPTTPDHATAEPHVAAPMSERSAAAPSPSPIATPPSTPSTSSSSPAAVTADAAVPTDPIATDAPSTPNGARAVTGAPSAASSPSNTAPPATIVVLQSGPAAEPVRPRTGGLFRAPIFERWRESQIRRHFGPLGLESTADLLRDPLARRQRPGGPALPILVLGSGAAAKARSLREELTRSGGPRFVLHVADPLSPSPDELPAMDSLEETPRNHRAPESAGELERLLRELAPAAIVVRDFLTAQREVESWLEVLRGACDDGACLVLLEETGRGAVVPSDEIDAIGQRIWELLPERYTRDPVTETPVASYREAFARRIAPPRNGLLGALRSRFELELYAQFGFLAEAFVSGPIAGCFDADAARDRRFLEQITDLDDRRVEAGSTAALHLIARVDPLAPR